MLLKDLFCLARNVMAGVLLQEGGEQNKVSSSPPPVIHPPRMFGAEHFVTEGDQTLELAQMLRTLEYSLREGPHHVPCFSAQRQAMQLLPQSRNSSAYPRNSVLAFTVPNGHKMRHSGSRCGSS